MYVFILSFFFLFISVHRGLGGFSERHIREFTHKPSLWQHATHRAAVYSPNAAQREVIHCFMSMCVRVYLFLDANTVHVYFSASTSCIAFWSRLVYFYVLQTL